MFSIIVAACRSGAIGRDGGVIHKVKEDFQFFKKTTMGHTIIVGRKTYESIPNRLTGRRVIVISSNKDYHCAFRDDIIVVENFDQAVEYSQNDDEVFIIGGAQIYKPAIKIADRIYLTLFNDFCGGDTFFPNIYWNNEWKIVHSENFFTTKGLAYQRLVIERERKITLSNIRADLERSVEKVI